MKYTDRQRLEKISDYCEKLMIYINDNQIDRDKLMDDYTIL